MRPAPRARSSTDLDRPRPKKPRNKYSDPPSAAAFLPRFPGWDPRAPAQRISDDDRVGVPDACAAAAARIRRRILQLLARGPSCAGDVAAHFEVACSGI